MKYLLALGFVTINLWIIGQSSTYFTFENKEIYTMQVADQLYCDSDIKEFQIKSVEKPDYKSTCGARFYFYYDSKAINKILKLKGKMHIAQLDKLVNNEYRFSLIIEKYEKKFLNESRIRKGVEVIRLKIIPNEGDEGISIEILDREMK